MLAQLLAVMAPVLFSAGLGFLWIKLGYSFPTSFVSRLTLNIGTPCLILAKLPTSGVTLENFNSILIAMILIMLLMGLAGYMLCRWRKLDWQIYLPAMLFPNTGNMGLPISQYAFQKSGLGIAIAIMVVVSLVQFTQGSMTSKKPLLSLIKTPTIYAIIIALLMMATHTELPEWLFNTVDLVSGFTIPLMLITLGVSLASIQVKNILAGLIFSFIRTLLAAGISLLVCTLLHLDAYKTGQIALQVCMPVAVYNYLFAQRAGRSPETVASLVFCSTLLSFIYLPIILRIIFIYTPPNV